MRLRNGTVRSVLPALCRDNRMACGWRRGIGLRKQIPLNRLFSRSNPSLQRLLCGGGRIRCLPVAAAGCREGRRVWTNCLIPPYRLSSRSNLCLQRLLCGGGRIRCLPVVTVGCREGRRVWTNCIIPLCRLFSRSNFCLQRLLSSGGRIDCCRLQREPAGVDEPYRSFSRWQSCVRQDV